MGLHKNIRPNKLISIIIIFTLAFSLLNFIGFINQAKAWPIIDPPSSMPPDIDIPCSQDNNIRYYRSVPFISIDLKKHTTDPDTSDDDLIFSSSGSANFDVTIDDGWANVELTGFVGDTITFTAEDPEGNSDSQDIDFVVYNSLPDSQGPYTLDATNVLQTSGTVNGKRFNMMTSLSFMVDNDCDWWVDLNRGAWEEDADGSSGEIIFSDLTSLKEGKIYFYRAKQVIWSGGVGDVRLGEVKWFIAEAPAPPNTDPEAVNDPATVDQDTSNNQIDVLANDNDADGDSLSISSVGGAVEGSTSHDGSYVFYTPNLGYSGSDSFSYTISDGNGGSSMAVVTVTINGINNDPEAFDDPATVSQDTSNNQIDVLANDKDSDGDSLSISEVKGAKQGSTSHDGSYIYYTPNLGYSGSDSFSYTISDGNGGKDTATVTVTVNLVTYIPEKPTIEGEVQTCYTTIEYRFESVLNDIGPNAKYYFYWDDGEEIPDVSLWTPVIDTPLSEIHSFSKAGVYDIKVGVVVDVGSGTLTEWSLPYPIQVIHKSEQPEDG